jgi:hypothetical protein
MTAALTPLLALDYLRQLSADIRAAIVLDGDGNRVAGPEPLAAAARALVAHGPLVHARAPGGAAFGARGERHALVVATGPLALGGLTLHDLRATLAALGDAPPTSAPSAAPSAAAEALLAALRDVVQ